MTVVTLALFLATLTWGSSLTWAKVRGERIDQTSGLLSGALLGPLVLLA